MNKYTDEYLKKVKVASHLIEPPAAEVIGELCDEISALNKRVQELEVEADRLAMNLKMYQETLAGYGFRIVWDTNKQKHIMIGHGVTYIPEASHD